MSSLVPGVPGVPKELFRRGIGYRALERVFLALQHFQERMIRDNAETVKAAEADIAAAVLRMVEREDLAQQFESRRDFSIRLIQQTPLMRQHTPRVRMKRLREDIQQPLDGIGHPRRRNTSRSADL